MPVSISGTNGIVFPDNSLQTAAASPFGLKNRIINGDMVIDQRNNGASITPTASAYTLDRWLASLNVASKFSVQQNAGSVTPPAGFINYLGVTSTSAYSVTSTDSLSIQQRIEGFNTADLNFGTANARTITLSFWVRSSLTGTFGGQIFGSPTRSYPFTYSIPTANTWTYITITIAGDTTINTYNTTNGFSLIVVFGLGSGSSASGGTVNTWQNGNFTQPTGTVSVVGTNGATWYITGVQLERNTTATPFEWIPYSTELALCQRYYQTSTNVQGIANGTTSLLFNVGIPVIMRASPSVGLTGVYSASDIYTADVTQSSATLGTLFGTSATSLLIGTSSWSGLVSGRVYLSRYNNANVFTLSAEL
jgi:hypothetical protein